MSRLLQRLSEEGYVDEANVEVVERNSTRHWKTSDN